MLITIISRKQNRLSFFFFFEVWSLAPWLLAFFWLRVAPGAWQRVCVCGLVLMLAQELTNVIGLRTDVCQIVLEHILGYLNGYAEGHVGCLLDARVELILVWFIRCRVVAYLTCRNEEEVFGHSVGSTAEDRQHDAGKGEGIVRLAGCDALAIQHNRRERRTRAEESATLS